MSGLIPWYHTLCTQHKATGTILTMSLVWPSPGLTPGPRAQQTDTLPLACFNMQNQQNLVPTSSKLVLKTSASFLSIISHRPVGLDNALAELWSFIVSRTQQLNILNQRLSKFIHSYNTVVSPESLLSQILCKWQLNNKNFLFQVSQKNFDATNAFWTLNL